MKYLPYWVSTVVLSSLKLSYIATISAVAMTKELLALPEGERLTKSLPTKHLSKLGRISSAGALPQ